MPRIARIVAVGIPHHITQRGNYRQEVFIDDSDRLQYLKWIGEYSLKHGVSILAYCLMQNHVHFIAIPSQGNSLAKTFNAAHMRYSQYFNRKRKQSGHLWQGRFYSCILDEARLLVAARYIERNPVRAKLVNTPWEWKWSSALEHVGDENECHVKLADLLSIIGKSHDSWKKYILSEEEASFIKEIRKYTLTGRPFGGDLFLRRMENTLGRRLRALPIGRPSRQ